MMKYSQQDAYAKYQELIAEMCIQAFKDYGEDAPSVVAKTNEIFHGKGHKDLIEEMNNDGSLSYLVGDSSNEVRNERFESLKRLVDEILEQE